MVPPIPVSARRFPFWLVSIAGGALLLVGVVAYWVLHGPENADPCEALQDKSVRITANNYVGVLGPKGISLARRSDGTYKFDTVIEFSNEPADPVTGTCRNGEVSFTRTHKDALVQEYSGVLSGDASTARQMAGKFSHNAPEKNLIWSGQIMK